MKFPLILPIWLTLGGCAEAQTKKAKESAPPPPPKDPAVIFQADFEDLKPGPIPPTYFVIDGTWTIAELAGGGGKVLQLGETPLLDGQLQVGDSLKDIGGTVTVKVKADKKRRSQPRFGVGLHGMTGYRLRIFPVRNQVELVKNEEVVASAELVWDAAKWWHLELTVDRETPDGEWQIAGRAWPEDGARPAKAQVTHTAPAATKFSGKASVSGTPFAALPIAFDHIEVRKSGAGAVAEEKPKG